MKRIFLFSALALLLSAMGSCEKEEKKQADILKNEAMIIYTGEPAADGCGYFVKINNKEYKPINLLPEFCVEGVIINVEYQILEEKWTCNWRGAYPQINIINISRKEDYKCPPCMQEKIDDFMGNPFDKMGAIRKYKNKGETVYIFWKFIANERVEVVDKDCNIIESFISRCCWT